MLSIPLRTLENAGQESTGKFVFPAGAYRGVIESTEIKELPRTSTGEKFHGYTGTDGERLSVKIGSIEALEGQEGVGNRKYFIDLVLRDDQHTLENIDVTAQNHLAWQLQKSAILITTLAFATGNTTLVDVGGEQRAAVDPAFIDALRNGGLDGMTVSWSVKHRKGKNDAVYPETERFLVA